MDKTQKWISKRPNIESNRDMAARTFHVWLKFGRGRNTMLRIASWGWGNSCPLPIETQGEKVRSIKILRLVLVAGQKLGSRKPTELTQKEMAKASKADNSKSPQESPAQSLNSIWARPRPSSIAGDHLSKSRPPHKMAIRKPQARPRYQKWTLALY